MINILADQDLPFVKDYFADLARVQLMPGRKIDAAAVKDADTGHVKSTFCLLPRLHLVVEHE